MRGLNCTTCFSVLAVLLAFSVVKNNAESTSELISEETEIEGMPRNVQIEERQGSTSMTNEVHLDVKPALPKAIDLISSSIIVGTFATIITVVPWWDIITYLFTTSVDAVVRGDIPWEDVLMFFITAPITQYTIGTFGRYVAGGFDFLQQ